MKPQGFLLTAGGLGLLPKMPGTFGSMLPVVVALGLVGAGQSTLVTGVMVALAVVGSFACVQFGRWAESHFGEKDAQAIVADEVAGQAIALFFIPWRAAGTEHALLWNLGFAAAAFLCFRFFDITKLGPVNRVQSLPRGWGVLLDDIIAGVFAFWIMQGISRLLL